MSAQPDDCLYSAGKLAGDQSILVSLDPTDRGQVRGDVGGRGRWRRWRRKRRRSEGHKER